jgi:DNA-binding NtrC family response regulator
MKNKNLLDGKDILIVDDEPDVLEALEELLPMCNFEKAANFEEAKRLFEKENFDLAVLDIMGVDGYKLLEISNKKEIITIMLTAHALSPENTVRSFKEGAAFYVPKDELHNIELFLKDVLEAKEKGRHSWSRWLDRFNSYYEKVFGEDWQDHDKEFWEKFNKYYIY